MRSLIVAAAATLIVAGGLYLLGGARTALRACEFRNEQAWDQNQGLRERAFAQDVRIADLEARLAARP